MVKVSIIVPVYNVEKYLVKCLDSLLCQTMEDIEIILVNDASPDGSHLIMKDYGRRFGDKVKCINLIENLCLGGARNKGVEAASGEYIMFVDSDDWIDKTMCEKMYIKAKENNSDIVFCNYVMIWEESNKKRERLLVSEAQMGEINKTKLKSLLFADHYAWAKLIRRTILIENNITYPEHTMYEDIPTTRFYLIYSKRIDKVEEGLYYYFQRETSITHSRDERFQYNEAEMALLFYQRCCERGLMENYSNEIFMLFTKMFYLFPLDSCIKKFTNPPLEHMNYLRTKMQELYPNYLNNPYINKQSEPILLELAKANDISPGYLIKQYKKGSYNINNIHYDKYYEEEKNKIKDLFEAFEIRKWCIALWGAGTKGRDFLKVNALVTKSLYVIDKDDKLHGSQLESGHKIYNFANVKDKVDVILIANQNNYCDIKFSIEREKIDRKIKLFDLDGYLKNQFLADDWIKE